MCVRGASSSLVSTTNMDAYKKLGRTYSSSNSNNVLFITIVYFYSYLVLKTIRKSTRSKSEVDYHEVQHRYDDIIQD